MYHLLQSRDIGPHSVIQVFYLLSPPPWALTVKERVTNVWLSEFFIGTW